MGRKSVDAAKLKKKFRKMQDLGPIKKVVQVNTAELQQKAQRRAVVDSGNLKRSIMLQIENAGMTGRVESMAAYGAYVEYGTRFMYAQPYLVPAYLEQRSLFIKDMEALVK
ncbi:HK97-gp10 family putative phage morphogenesis protein [Listeria monocytogenes]|uniref:HK97-gp10 family putative phage morphogenesis protein n=1 Tax=Listeria monocytogenes TaxID=1639 RepID=UPI00086D9F28|nr:HK97-gp10 family putative phage morphogenesis protein [Listeria monocytogenes]EAE5023162.1 hypothetical protein [Listeria monocytogenes]EAG6738006.1 hypothetical protein [Listeria monocytogenes]EED2333579.1 hypothetical protein [Listeria monocytogenes]EFQ8242017.1 hypothetical protein [Listeria monocytogenes]EGP9974983.1 hypothetical protein [Listeria monocytogenes]